MRQDKGANFVRQSYAGAVRQRLAHIERSIAFGARQDLLRQELHTIGFDASLGTFRKSLWRARRWWRAQIIAARSAPLGLSISAAPLLPVQHPSSIAHEKTITPPTHPPIHQSPQSVRPPPSPKATTPTARKPVTHIDVDAFFKRKSVFAKP